MKPVIVWPDRLERSRILRMCIRRQRRPQRSCRLPRAWRRQRRLAFWWQLAILVQDQPRLLLCAVAAGPLWIVITLLHWGL